jgi:hypothetical protein
MSGFITLKCNFMVDQPTINNRIYPRAMMESAIKEYLTNGSRAGELLAYSNGKEFGASTNLRAASHVVQDVHLEENGEIKVDFKILDTAAGRMVEALLIEVPGSLMPNMIMAGKLKQHKNGMGELTSYSEVEDLKVASIDLYCKPLNEQKS